MGLAASMTSIYWSLYTGPALESILSPGERTVLAGLRFSKRRAEWLLGRAAAKSLLLAAHPACAASPPARLTIQNEPGGAPFTLLDGRPLPGCLSLSHREHLACAALSLAPDLPIGIDLERIEPRTPAFIDTFLTPTEAATCLALSAPDQDRYAVTCWSAKEAVLKALRIGLRADTRAVELLEIASPAPDGWGCLRLRSTLPGVERLNAWWRQDGEFIITLAVLGPPVSLQRV